MTDRDRETPGGGRPDDEAAEPGAVLPLALLSIAVLLAMAPWFSASAVSRELGAAWGLGPSGRAWLTAGVQLGFVLGASTIAVLNLADRWPAHRLFVASAGVAALATAGIVWLDDSAAAGLTLRVVTGAAFAGVYPPGMKIAASWTARSRGLALGLLVGAIALGSATPHLLGALATEGAVLPWRGVLLSSAALAGAGALLAAAWVRPGPLLSRSAPFAWRHAADPVRNPPLRLVNLAYLGHMWELYAMWTWVPLVLVTAYERAGWSPSAARLAGFCAVGAGALGSVVAGWLADRIGRTAVAGGSLVVSGACCLVAGTLLAHPAWLTALCIVWGVTVVSDSAQFSAAASELADPRYVGTSLSVQTCLGFLLTLATIFALPVIAESLGWRGALPLLALGPVVGIASLLRLRRMPESRRLAGGRR